MKYCIRTLLMAGFILFVTAGDNNMKFNPLTEAEKAIIIDKGTEAPFSGKYYDFDENGVYTCKRCGAELYRSSDKFDAQCGWPSFDAAIPNAIKKYPMQMADAQRFFVQIAADIWATSLPARDSLHGIHAIVSIHFHWIFRRPLNVKRSKPLFLPQAVSGALNSIFKKPRECYPPLWDIPAES